MPTALKKLNFFLKVKKLKKAPKSSIVSVVKNISFIKDTMPFLESKFRASLVIFLLFRLSFFPIAIIIPVPNDVTPRPPI